MPVYSLVTLDIPKDSVNLLLNHRVLTASTFPSLLPLLHHHRHGSKYSLEYVPGTGQRGELIQP